MLKQEHETNTKFQLVKKGCRVRHGKTVYSGNLYYYGGVAILTEVGVNGIDEKFWEYDVIVKEFTEIPTVLLPKFSYILKGIFRVQKKFLDEIHSVSREAEEFIRRGWN